MNIKRLLLQLLRSRLSVYSKFMTCKPSLAAVNGSDANTNRIKIKLDDIRVQTLLMLSGLWYEEHVGGLSRIKPRKHIKVQDAEELLKLLHLDSVSLPIPCTGYSDLFECDVRDNIVYEFWALTVRPTLVELATKGRLVFFSPDIKYVKNFTALIKNIRVAVGGAEEAYVYVVSKFSYPGFLGKFLESFKDIPETRLVLATSSNVGNFASKNYDNVKIVSTKSHRKILLILAKLSNSEWEVLGFHGSMNVFAPGTDDYMICANDFVDLTVVIHGLLRSLLMV